MSFIRSRWSPSGDYLLLDNNELGTPIWRISAEGTGEVEVVIENGLLLDALPALP